MTLGVTPGIRGQHSRLAEEEGRDVVVLEHQLRQLLPLGPGVPLRHRGHWGHSGGHPSPWPRPRGGTYRGLGHEHRVQPRLRLDVFAVGVVQDGLETLPVLDWDQGDKGGRVTSDDPRDGPYGCPRGPGGCPHPASPFPHRDVPGVFPHCPPMSSCVSLCPPVSLLFPLVPKCPHAVPPVPGLSLRPLCPHSSPCVPPMSPHPCCPPMSSHVPCCPQCPRCPQTHSCRS